MYRKTSETDIRIELNLDGTGKSAIDTGIGFFDHMLEQIARHGNMDLNIKVNGDLQIDEHHTVEDVAIALGEAVLKALGGKKGIERYSFVLPMDDCLAQVALDFGGRSWLVWEVKFTREKIGELPLKCSFISSSHSQTMQNATLISKLMVRMNITKLKQFSKHSLKQ